jgi:hypothetical protein
MDIRYAIADGMTHSFGFWLSHSDIPISSRLKINLTFIPWTYSRCISSRMTSDRVARQRKPGKLDLPKEKEIVRRTTVLRSKGKWYKNCF